VLGQESILPNLPHRLRELRQELGWSLDDVAVRVGVTQRGVVSNWEAVNQRRRTPPLTTLLSLQLWYGVSMDYLLGNPLAERDSPAVVAGKATLQAALRSSNVPEVISPSDRARLATELALQVAPEAFFSDRVAAWLAVAGEDFAIMMGSGVWADASLHRLAALLGIPATWFYSDDKHGKGPTT